MKFKNGASVSRIWHDGSSEMLAEFQYFTDAKEWAIHLAQSDQNTERQLVAVCHCYGEVFATGYKSEAQSD